MLQLKIPLAQPRWKIPRAAIKTQRNQINIKIKYCVHLSAPREPLLNDNNITTGGWTLAFEKVGWVLDIQAFIASPGKS